MAALQPEPLVDEHQQIVLLVCEHEAGFLVPQRHDIWNKLETSIHVLVMFGNT
jgi:hypothetical protein